MKISGTFDVQLKPIDGYAKGEDGINLGRMSIDKVFVGELAASSQGEMLSAVTQTPGSAGYGDIEKGSGRLRGKKGS